MTQAVIVFLLFVFITSTNIDSNICGINTVRSPRLLYECLSLINIPIPSCPSLFSDLDLCCN